MLKGRGDLNVTHISNTFSKSKHKHIPSLPEYTEGLKPSVCPAMDRHKYPTANLRVNVLRVQDSELHWV